LPGEGAALMPEPDKMMIVSAYEFRRKIVTDYQMCVELDIEDKCRF